MLRNRDRSHFPILLLSLGVSLLCDDTSLGALESG